MVQLIKFLPLKHEDLSLDPPHPYKNPSGRDMSTILAPVCVSGGVRGWTETGRSLRLDHGGPAGSVKDLCSKNKME